jgi:hypothetical protein
MAVMYHYVCTCPRAGDRKQAADPPGGTGNQHDPIAQGQGIHHISPK